MPPLKLINLKSFLDQRTNKLLKTMKFIALLILICQCTGYLHYGTLKSTKTMTHLNAVTTNKSPEKKIIAPKFVGSCGITGITLTRYLIEAVAANPHMKELESVF